MPSINIIIKWPPSNAGKGKMFIIARLKLKKARKNTKLKIPLSADLTAYCAIFIGPPKAFQNAIFPEKTFPTI